jgi:hypothetical protein
MPELSSGRNDAATHSHSQMVITTRGCKPMTPPPLPSHKGIGARQTGHLDRFKLASRREELQYSQLTLRQG